MIKPPPNVLDLPLAERAEMAFTAAVDKAIIDHARRGIPFYVWEDGKVVEIPSEGLRKLADRIEKEE